MKRLPLIVSFLLFIALCASIAYWALQLFKPPTRPVAAPPRIAKADISTDAAAALFGGRPGKVAVASNYQLKGVILSGTAPDSVAILSTDGKPAQAVRVSMEVVPGVSVKEVHREYVLLSEGGAIKRVDLPESAKMQVNIASAAPVGTQGNVTHGSVTPPPTTARGQLSPTTAPTPAGQTSGSAANQTQSPRSPLLPPPAPQGQQQAQPQGQSQTAPAVPATVVVSPPPSGQTPAASTGAVAQQPGAGAAATPVPAAPTAPAYQPAITPSAPAARPVPGSAGTSGSGGEMLPPSTLQSR